MKRFKAHLEEKEPDTLAMLAAKEKGEKEAKKKEDDEEKESQPKKDKEEKPNED